MVNMDRYNFSFYPSYITKLYHLLPFVLTREPEGVGWVGKPNIPNFMCWVTPAANPTYSLGSLDSRIWPTAVGWGSAIISDAPDVPSFQTRRLSHYKNRD